MSGYIYKTWVVRIANTAEQLTTINDKKAHQIPLPSCTPTAQLKINEEIHDARRVLRISYLSQPITRISNQQLISPNITKARMCTKHPFYCAFPGCKEIVAWATSSACTSVKNHNPLKFRPEDREPGWCGKLETGDPYRSSNERCEKHRQGEDDETRRKRMNEQSFPPPPMPNGMRRLINFPGRN